MDTPLSTCIRTKNTNIFKLHICPMDVQSYLHRKHQTMHFFHVVQTDDAVADSL